MDGFQRSWQNEQFHDNNKERTVSATSPILRRISLSTWLLKGGDDISDDVGMLSRLHDKPRLVERGGGARDNERKARQSPEYVRYRAFQSHVIPSNINGSQKG
jgi:hypothetical protein